MSDISFLSKDKIKISMNELADKIVEYSNKNYSNAPYTQGHLWDEMIRSYVKQMEILEKRKKKKEDKK